ncbi:MAG: CPBP family intramembrane metalloprotease [Lachnospiraceae bacterium]|nr:CPBP family intramembrane metalloprotease [Lachnospiraceae bacterium]
MIKENRIVKHTNALFLCMIISYLLTTVLVSLLSAAGIDIGAIEAVILGEIVILLPVPIYFIVTKADLKNMIPHRRIKLSTVFLCILFGFLIMPGAQWLNAISQLFSTNIAMDAVLDIMEDLPFIPTFLAIAVIGPLCEELSFRGVILSGLKRSGRVFAAIAVSSLFFGLMHLNLNQLFYAAYIGFFCALLTEATGSIIAPFIVHFVINGYNTAMPYLASGMLDKMYDGGSEILNEIAEEGYTQFQILSTSLLLLAPAVIGIILAMFVYFRICKIEGSKEYICHILKIKKKDSEVSEEESISSEDNVVSANDPEPSGLVDQYNTEAPRQKVITVSGYIAIGLCALIIFCLGFALQILGLKG